MRFQASFWAFAVAALTVGCGGNSTGGLGDCPSAGATTTAQQLAGRTYIQTSCALGGCHGNGAAQGGVSLSTLESIRVHAKSSYDQVESGQMPQGASTRTSSTTLEALRVFLSCGAPDVK